MNLETAVDRLLPSGGPRAPDSPPLQGEGWVGMGFAVLVSTPPLGKAAWLAFLGSVPNDTLSNPIPTPALPLKGREQNRREEVAA
jgi:hypothetical protein